MTLFSRAPQAESGHDSRSPLAHRMSPRSLDEFVGQTHFLGAGKLLCRMIQADRLSSVIFYGPPGTGKTALARIIATTTQARFEELNAAASNVAEVKAMLALAQETWAERRRLVLFVDEIHRFNKAQQDVLLPAVEKGLILLIGATTHNPFFSINPALVSRSHIFEFKPLSGEDVVLLLRRALGDAARGLGQYPLEASEEALSHLAKVCDGDARRALSALEVAALTTPPSADGKICLGLKEAEESIQKKAVLYDRDEDAHYDVASAFIKSLRGSDPDAAIYWLARMLEAGEDPRFIARRLVIFAAEDVGNAAPYALVIANAAFQVAEFVGLPEAQIPLAQATLYLATSPKSNSSIAALERALEEVRKGRILEVPDALKDSHYASAARLGRGEGYQYPHEFEGHFVAQNYLPVDKIFYEPSDQGHELEIRRRLDEWRKRQKNS